MFGLYKLCNAHSVLIDCLCDIVCAMWLCGVELLWPNANQMHVLANVCVNASSMYCRNSVLFNHCGYCECDTQLACAKILNFIHIRVKTCKAINPNRNGKCRKKNGSKMINIFPLGYVAASNGFVAQLTWPHIREDANLLNLSISKP